MTQALNRRIERLEALIGQADCICPGRDALDLSVWIYWDLRAECRDRLSAQLAAWKAHQALPTTCPVHGWIDQEEVHVGLVGRQREPFDAYQRRVEQYLSTELRNP